MAEAVGNKGRLCDAPVNLPFDEVSAKGELLAEYSKALEVRRTVAAWNADPAGNAVAAPFIWPHFDYHH